MKTITLTILFLLIASPLLASKVVVWNNERPVTFNVDRDGEVVTITHDQSGGIEGNVNNGKLFDLRQPPINSGNPTRNWAVVPMSEALTINNPYMK